MRRQLVDYRMTNEEECVEFFTITNLNSVMYVNKNNCQTKSFILAPYNSVEKNIEKLEKIEKIKDVKEGEGEGEKPKSLLTGLYANLPIENKAMYYAPCVIDVNREFERKYYDDVDEGKLIGQINQGSFNLESSIFIEDSKGRASKVNDFGSWRKSKINKEYNSTSSYGVYNDSIIAQMVELGYPKEYTIQCLKNNDLNYCTACYYLLMKNVENPEAID